MKIIKNEIRPIGYVTIELSEAEIQSIVGSLEEISMYRNMPYGEMKGIRGDIYAKFCELLTPQS